MEEENGLVAHRLEGLRSLVGGDAAVFPLLLFRDDNGRRLLGQRLDSIDAKVRSAQERLSASRAAMEQRRLAEQAARKAAEKAEREAAEKAARKAAARAARQAAEAAARNAAARAAREAAAEEARRARDAAPPRRTPDGGSSSGGSGSGSSGGGHDGYTGCRAYGPNGSSIDEKGRPYTKISC